MKKYYYVITKKRNLTKFLNSIVTGKPLALSKRKAIQIANLLNNYKENAFVLISLKEIQNQFFKMKKATTIKHLKRICTKCKNSQMLWGNRYCRLIKPNFNENGACMDFVQAPKEQEKYEQLSLFDEVLK